LDTCKAWRKHGVVRILREQRNGIENPVDRRQALEVARLLFKSDAGEAMRERTPPQRPHPRQPRRAALERRHCRPRHAQGTARRHIKVRARDVMTMRGEVDGIVGLAIELAPQLRGYRAELGAEARAIEEADGEIDVAGVAIEMIGMDGGTSGK